MVNQLRGFLSGRLKKPIIINGRLVTMDNRILMASRDNYKVIFTLVGAGTTETVIENGEEIIEKRAVEFNRKYSKIYGRQNDDVTQFSASVDSFTGAVILKNPLYEFLLDKNDEQHFHDGTRQFTEDTQKLITEFTKELVINYFEIYCHLFNRRLMASHMPIMIKGHLVSGFYQPLVIRTRGIDCPLELGEFAWFHEFINSPEVCEKRLESIQETTRGLELTAISMYDFSAKFGVSCVKELNRLYFMFILYTILINTLEDGASGEMVNHFKKIYASIQNQRVLITFFAECVQSVQRMRTGLMIR